MEDVEHIWPAELLRVDVTRFALQNGRRYAARCMLRHFTSLCGCHFHKKLEYSTQHAGYAWDIYGAKWEAEESLQRYVHISRTQVGSIDLCITDFFLPLSTDQFPRPHAPCAPARGTEASFPE